MVTRNDNKHKVVDNIKTRLQELIQALDNLYEKLEQELSSLVNSSNFDEINMMLIDGFRNVIDRRAPSFELMSDVESENSNEDEKGMKTGSEELIDDNKEIDGIEQQRKKDVENIIRMLQLTSNK